MMKVCGFFAKALIVASLWFSQTPAKLAAQDLQTFDGPADRQGGIGGSFNVSIDLLGIANAISSAVNTAQNRPGWVKNLMETSFYASGQNHNVMVFNLNQNYDYNFQQVKFYGSAIYDGMTYGIWVFESGEFWNWGDGGWINWAYMGWHQRDGGYVSFRKP